MNEAFLFRFGDFQTRVHFVESLDLESEALFVFDRNVHRLHGRSSAGVIIPAGEASKGWRSVDRILRRALSAGLGRDGRVVGVGGGVVCDLAAFAASLYMRGCRLVLVPTTLLAMVDAALGGKSAINLGGAKNLAGTFYPAEELRICVPVLETLPERELKSGLAEAIKTALIGDPALLELLTRKRAQILGRDPSVLEEVVFRSLAVKGRIVENDFREAGARAVLNLGHTFGHALESASGFRRFSHGEAIAWGLGRALALGVRLGLTADRLARELQGLLRDYGYALDTPPRLAPERILRAMQADKKKRDGRLRLVLLREVGEPVVQVIDEQSILEVLT